MIGKIGICFLPCLTVFWGNLQNTLSVSVVVLYSMAKNQAEILFNNPSSPILY